MVGIKAFGIIVILLPLISSDLYYKNLTGNVYGPFPDDQVRGWWEAGYFNDGITKRIIQF